MQFDSFDFHASLSANVKSMGYESPTPIQREAIPHVLEGHDVMGLAQTGTGKTAAFLLPIIDRFLKTPKPIKGSCRALVIAPTRELAEQIHEAARALTKGMRFRSVTVYGGVGISPQTANLRRGADLVVACPGRLLDHLNQGNANLSGVEVLVLDEADHMFDMGFLPDIKKILSRLPAERQTLLFSATMPESIRGLAGETLRDPAVVRIGRSGPVQTIEQCLYPVPQHLKTKLLLNILGTAADGSVLVFTRTKHRAKRLAEQLCRMGHASACLQGNLSQNQRQKAMEGFRDGRFKVMVATDIAARGIDVSRVAHVVNFDLPDTPETYTHRVGRTGRAEREGQAHSLVTSEDVSMIKAIERLLGKPIERRKIEGFDYASNADRDRDFDRPTLAAGRYGQGGRGQAGQARGESRADQPRNDSRARSGRFAAGSRSDQGQPSSEGPSRNRSAQSGETSGGSRSGGYGGSRSAGRSGAPAGDRGYQRVAGADSGRSYSANPDNRFPGEHRASGGQPESRPEPGNSWEGSNSGGRYGYDQHPSGGQSRQPRRESAVRGAGDGGGFYGRAPEAGGNRRPGQDKDASANEDRANRRTRQGQDGEEAA